MEIYFLCHGDAEIPLFKTPRADFERNLSEHGIASIMNEAYGLKEFVPDFDVIFTSPITRAMQTADIFAEVFDCHDEVHKLIALAPPGDIEGLMETFALAGDVERILCVGHSPSLEIMASEIITGLEEERLFPLKNGGILCFRMEKPQLHSEAEIEYLMDPIFLIKLGEMRHLQNKTGTKSDRKFRQDEKEHRHAGYQVETEDEDAEYEDSEDDNNTATEKVKPDFFV